jgi:hypothetical protein
VSPVPWATVAPARARGQCGPVASHNIKERARDCVVGGGSERQVPFTDGFSGEERIRVLARATTGDRRNARPSPSVSTHETEQYWRRRALQGQGSGADCRSHNLKADGRRPFAQQLESRGQVQIFLTEPVHPGQLVIRGGGVGQCLAQSGAMCLAPHRVNTRPLRDTVGERRYGACCVQQQPVHGPLEVGAIWSLRAGALASSLRIRLASHDGRERTFQQARSPRGDPRE